MGRRRRNILALPCGLLLLFWVTAPAQGLERECVWTGSGDGSSYSDADNWDCGLSPCNLGPIAFTVEIPAGAGPVDMDVASCEVETLDVGDDARFNVLSGNVFTVRGAASEYGVVDVMGGDFSASPLTFPGNRARLYASEGGQVALGSGEYSSTGLYGTSGGWGNPRTHTVHLMEVAGAGSALRLPEVTRIDAGFNDGDGYDTNIQRIIARDGGVIELSGVSSVVGPASGGDRIEFLCGTAGDPTDASAVDLSGLRETGTPGAGSMRLQLAGGCTFTAGDWAIRVPTTVELQDAATLAPEGLAAGRPTTLDFNSDPASLDVAGTLDLRDTMTIQGAESATIFLGGNFSHGHTDEDQVPLGSTAVVFDGGRGEEGAQTVEVAGIDVDVYVELLSDENFGFGEMTVGESAEAAAQSMGIRSTVVRLRDAIDNGNGHDICGDRREDREALYLWEGLRIGPGSTLVLDGLHVFAFQEGVWAHLNELFDPSDPEDAVVAFDEGFVKKGSLHPDADGDGVYDTADNCAVTANDQTDSDGDGYGDECDGDLNNDGAADDGDLTAFAAELGSEVCPGTGCVGDLDGDGDGDVDGSDIARYAAVGPGTLGPSCVL
ncbi:MAG: hypothetical protein Kow0092_33940 [Deferrisomatales bacterium]